MVEQDFVGDQISTSVVADCLQLQVNRLSDTAQFSAAILVGAHTCRFHANPATDSQATACSRAECVH